MKSQIYDMEYQEESDHGGNWIIKDSDLIRSVKMHFKSEIVNITEIRADYTHDYYLNVELNTSWLMGDELTDLMYNCDLHLTRIMPKSDHGLILGFEIFDNKTTWQRYNKTRQRITRKFKRFNKE